LAVTGAPGGLAGAGAAGSGVASVAAFASTCGTDSAAAVFSAAGLFDPEASAIVVPSTAMPAAATSARCLVNRGFPGLLGLASVVSSRLPV
jgi:hypothetical protein